MLDCLASVVRFEVIQKRCLHIGQDSVCRLIRVTIHKRKCCIFSDQVLQFFLECDHKIVRNSFELGLHCIGVCCDLIRKILRAGRIEQRFKSRTVKERLHERIRKLGNKVSEIFTSNILIQSGLFQELIRMLLDLLIQPLGKAAGLILSCFLLFTVFALFFFPDRSGDLQILRRHAGFAEDRLVLHVDDIDGDGNAHARG